MKFISLACNPVLYLYYAIINPNTITVSDHRLSHIYFNYNSMNGFFRCWYNGISCYFWYLCVSLQCDEIVEKSLKKSRNILKYLFNVQCMYVVCGSWNFLNLVDIISYNILLTVGDWLCDAVWNNIPRIYIPK